MDMKRLIQSLKDWWRTNIVDEVPDHLADAEFNRARRSSAR